MFLENVVVDAVDPQQLGRFWEGVLGTQTLTDAPGIFETRLSVEGGPTLDLCFQPVPEARSEPPRLSLLLAATAPGKTDEQPSPETSGPRGNRWTNSDRERLLEAADVPAAAALRRDPDGTPFWVVGREEPREAPSVPQPTLASGGAALMLDAVLLASAHPARDAAFWSWLTGWRSIDASPADPSSWREVLTDPSAARGPRLVLLPEKEPKGPSKSRWHLDVRLETESLEDMADRVRERGGQHLVTSWGPLPWRSFTDPSGNEFCLLPPA